MFFLQWTWQLAPFQHSPIRDCDWAGNKKRSMFHSEQWHLSNREACRKHRLERFLLQLYRHVNCVFVHTDSLSVISWFTIFSLAHYLPNAHWHTVYPYYVAALWVSIRLPHLLSYLLTHTFTQSITYSLLSWINNSFIITHLHVPPKATNYGSHDHSLAW